jgi:hypothetical protein
LPSDEMIVSRMGGSCMTPPVLGLLCGLRFGLVARVTKAYAPIILRLGALGSIGIDRVSGAVAR